MKINCKKINKFYIDENSYNKNNVLGDVNLEISTGSIIALKGPSGSGKSTLLNIISGLDDPSSGNITFNDVLMQGLDINERTKFRNQNIGIVFQFFNLLDDFSVFENIAMPLFIRGENKENVKNKVCSLTDEIGLLNKINSNVSLLSGGESQRVAIARAMIGSPKIILADEPTGNLDKNNTDKIINFLIKTCRKNNTSLLMVTHDTELLTKFDKVYSLESGVLV